MSDRHLAALRLVRDASFDYAEAERRLQDLVAEALHEGASVQDMIRMTEQHPGTILAWRIMSEERARRKAALDEMTRQAQEDGLYDDPAANEIRRTR